MQINVKDYIQWGHVSSGHNPADVESRSSKSKELPKLCQKRPDGISKPEMWPVPVQPGSSKETEVKLVRRVFSVPVENEDSLHLVLQKRGFWQTICHHIMGNKVNS